jgi:hypothetical protein
MLKKGLHSILILLLVLAVPFGSVMAKPMGVIATQKKECPAKTKKAEEPVKELLQPQVVNALVTYVHALSPCIVDYNNVVFGFTTEDTFASSFEAQQVEPNASKFFKTLFRHYIATQAP